MTKKTETPLKLMINQMLRAYGYGDQLDEISLVKSWEDIVGEMVARHTTDIYYKKGKLYVSLDSAPLRQELSFVKSGLVEKLNIKAGKIMVREIIFK